VVRSTEDSTIPKCGRYEIRMHWTGESISDLNNGGYYAKGAEESKWNISIG
jgi:hypothetical protein